MPSEPSSIKVRLRNSDAQRGKSGGYRVIYYLKTKAKIILVTIYWAPRLIAILRT